MRIRRLVVALVLVLSFVTPLAAQDLGRTQRRERGA